MAAGRRIATAVLSTFPLAVFLAVFFTAALLLFGSAALAAPQEEPAAEPAAGEGDGARAFLDEAKKKYLLPFEAGLKSFGMDIELLEGGAARRGRTGGGAVTISYDWEAPDQEELTVEGVPPNIRKLLRQSFRGIWKDIAGCAVFPDLEAGDLAMEKTDEGTALTASSGEEAGARVLFDPETRLVLRAEAAAGDRKIILTPTFARADKGLYRLEAKEATVSGEGGGGASVSFDYGGFRKFGAFFLPTSLKLGLGQAEVTLGFTYTHINGKKPEPEAMDPAVVKARVKEFEKAYKGWSASEKIAGMESLAETGHDLAAMAIVAKGLKDKDLTVREEAAKILGRMGCRKAVSSLVKAMKPNARNTGVYLAVIGALGEIGDPKAVSYLSKDFWNQRDPGLGIRVARAKIDALGRIRSRKSVEALIDLLYKAGQGAMARVAGSITRSLEGLTGQKFGWDRERWKDWWKKNKAKFKLEEDK